MCVITATQAAQTPELLSVFLTIGTFLLGKYSYRSLPYTQNNKYLYLELLYQCIGSLRVNGVQFF